MKNFKLLLGATALLSTTALIVNADFNSATIGANVQFASPSVATQGNDIYFGYLDPAAGGILTVNPDGTFTGTAKVISAGGAYPIRSGSIKFSGGMIPAIAGDSYSLDTETDTYTQNMNSEHPNDPNQFLVKLALDGAKIDMYKGNYNNEDISSNPSCGYVDNLTQGNASWDGTYYTLRIGGTLNLDFDDDYADSDGSYSGCSGKTTVTYVLQQWF